MFIIWLISPILVMRLKLGMENEHRWTIYKWITMRCDLPILYGPSTDGLLWFTYYSHGDFPARPLRNPGVGIQTLKEQIDITRIAGPLLKPGKPGDGRSRVGNPWKYVIIIWNIWKHMGKYWNILGKYGKIRYWNILENHNCWYRFTDIW